MQNYTPIKSYRVLLTERQGRGFNESEVIEILQQLLPQLAPIHAQGLVHGGISVDTLLLDQNTSQAIVTSSLGAVPGYIAPEHLQTGEVSATGDIYALGMTMLILLTGQNPEALRNHDGTGNWQEYCVVSDDFASLLEKAIHIHPQHRFINAAQMLQALNSPVNLQVVAAPTKFSLPPVAPIPTVVEEQQSKKKSFPKFALWQWILICTVPISLLAAIAAPSFLNQAYKARQSEAKRDIGGMNRGQQALLLNYGEFTSDLDKLKQQMSREIDAPITNMGSSSSVTGYDYSIIAIDKKRIIQNIALAKREGLKSYTGIVFLTDDSDGITTSTLLCASEKPTLETPAQPIISGDYVECPPNYVDVDPSRAKVKISQLQTAPTTNISEGSKDDTSGQSDEATIPEPEVMEKSPVEFVREHYEILNQRQYEVAWNRLHPIFQNEAGSYSEYVRWWDSVSRIEIGKVSVVRETDTITVVNAELSYVMKRGDVVKDTKPNLSLIGDGSAAGWKIMSKY
jgi:type II secretory pathway pseudopilin PulG